MKRTIQLLALAMAASAAMAQPALRAHNPESSYSLEGAWLVEAKFPGSPTTTPYMDLYTSDSNNQGRSGTVLCTLPLGKSFNPVLGVYVTQTASGHGIWVRIDKNRFAVTAWRLIVNADTNQVVGSAKFWGTITMQTNDTMTGTMNAEFYAQNGTVMTSFKNGTSAGTRVAIQFEEQ